MALIAAFALLIAQIGAVRHTYAHAVDRGVVPALQQPLPAAVHDFCGDCLSYAPLLAAAGASTPACLDACPARTGESRPRPAHAPRAGPLPAFRSRAPPATR